MILEEKLQSDLREVFKSLYDFEPEDKSLVFQHTRKEFEGDRTLVVFPFLKISRKNPEQTADEIADRVFAIHGLIQSTSTVYLFAIFV